MRFTFFLMVTHVTAGDVFDGEISDTVKMGAFNFCSLIYYSKWEQSL